MRRRLEIAAGLLLLASVAFGQSLGLRVGSYNVRNSNGDKDTDNAWSLRKADLAALVKSLDLDAFGLQEVLPDQADYLRGELPSYKMAGVHRDDGDRRGEAVPVFYRADRFAALTNGTCWLSLTPDVPGSISWGGHVRASARGCFSEIGKPGCVSASPTRTPTMRAPRRVSRACG